MYVQRVKCPQQGSEFVRCISLESYRVVVAFALWADCDARAVGGAGTQIRVQGEHALKRRLFFCQGRAVDLRCSSMAWFISRKGRSDLEQCVLDEQHCIPISIVVY